MKDLLEVFLMSAAILGGTVTQPAQPPSDATPRIVHRQMMRKPKVRSTVEISSGKSAAPLPQPRPKVVTASLPPLNLLVSSPGFHVLPTQLSEPEVDQGPYPFIWEGRYALPSQWSLVWEFVG